MKNFIQSFYKYDRFDEHEIYAVKGIFFCNMMFKLKVMSKFFIK